MAACQPQAAEGCWAGWASSWETLEESDLVDGNALLHQISAELDLVAQIYPEICGIWKEVVVKKAGVPPSSAPACSSSWQYVLSVSAVCCPLLLDAKHFQ